MLSKVDYVLPYYSIDDSSCHSFLDPPPPVHAARPGAGNLTLLFDIPYNMKTETEIEKAAADAARHYNAQRLGIFKLPNELLYAVARILSNTKDTSALAHLYRICSLLQSIVGEEAYQKLVWEYRGSGDRKDRGRFGKLVKSFRVSNVELVSPFLLFF